MAGPLQYSTCGPSLAITSGGKKTQYRPVGQLELTAFTETVGPDTAVSFCREGIRGLDIFAPIQLKLPQRANEQAGHDDGCTPVLQLRNKRAPKNGGLEDIP